jgi:hypothetical protein
MRNSPRWSKRGVLVSSLVAGLAAALGCEHVAAVRQPISYVAAQMPLDVWVIRSHNDSVVRMQQPRVQGDTLVGFILSHHDSITTYQEIPAGDIKQMRARQAAPIRTIALIGGLTGAFLYVYRTQVGNAGGAPIPPGADGCFCDFDDICC